MDSAVTALLTDLQLALQRLQLWQLERPSEQALASQQPFCIDTLNFPQWLQFVFVERMQWLLAQQQPLPRNCQISPMAEQYFGPRLDQAATLLACIKRIDDLLSDA
ncbi:YqcC family protein [Dasania marina]|mgnify:CR=1 FL=1|uniref:YqcC family protein n=1 Tax=Dasania marina TaxID=471499 RepID=UPI0030DCC651|tara:strand:+ start:124370 stop:124687 length:318 start_codon:yes stop_codon:yes gene_type:complete